MYKKGNAPYFWGFTTWEKAILFSPLLYAIFLVRPLRDTKE